MKVKYAGNGGILKFRNGVCNLVSDSKVLVCGLQSTIPTFIFSPPEI
jgi:hypothetical protein